MLPKIVDENDHFKGEQREEHNLHINSWLISNWAKTKGKKRWGSQNGVELTMTASFM
jgi:uncharacterized protein YgiB involved in biofilm formation